uniref:Uncharacterized protein n=1 Tax=Pan paniscus TaxID=9597 RepID=A0A2R9C9H8_PANPA
MIVNRGSEADSTEAGNKVSVVCWVILPGSTEWPNTGTGLVSPLSKVVDFEGSVPFSALTMRELGDTHAEEARGEKVDSWSCLRWG